jgi:hypothetical protein
MARKKDSGKSSALSEEYIVDSDSNGPAEADPSAQKTSSNGVAAGPARKRQKSEKNASSKLIALTESPRSDSSVTGEDNVMEVSSSSSKESSREGEVESGGTTEATQKVQKKKPSKQNRASMYEFDRHLGGES